MKLPRDPQFCVLILFSLFLTVSEAKCQSHFTDDLKLTATYHYGYVLPEYSYFLYIVDAPIKSVGLSFSKATTGKNDWEKLYNYPEYGISLLYSTLGSDRVFGREIAIVPFFHLNMISRKHFNFFNETGIGLGYVTKHFDFENNYENIAVGSHLNLHFNLKFGVNYEAFKNVILNAGLSFDHFSNGNTQNPNIGINFVTAYSGVSYRLGNENPRQNADLSPFQKSWNYELIASVGAKRSRGVLESDLFYTSSFTFEAKWNIRRSLRLGAGADVFYDPSTKTEMESTNNSSYQSADDFRSGIHLSQEFVYSRLSLILQEGFYIGLTDQVNHKPVYNRGIVRMQVSKRSFVQLAMKSHLNILDYPELGFGMKWK